MSTLLRKDWNKRQAGGVMEIKTIEFEKPAADGASCVASAWAKVPEPLTPAQRAQLKERARQLLKEKGAVLVAHYYVDSDLQDLAEETGGCVSDSLEMARVGRDHAAQTLVVAGGRFMGGPARGLAPDKTRLMEDPPRVEPANSTKSGRAATMASIFGSMPPPKRGKVFTEAGQLE